MSRSSLRRCAASLALAGLALAHTAVPAAADHRIVLPVSVANGGSAGTETAEWIGAAADGSRTFFITRERLVARDNDDHADIYRRAGAELSLVSVAEEGVDSEPADVTMPADSRAPITPSGEQIVFQTTETLTMQDDDGGEADLYVRDGDTTRLVTVPSQPFSFVSNTGFFPKVRIDPTGARIVFETGDQLANDTDVSSDVYRWEDGTVTLLAAPGSGNVHLAAASSDATKVFVQTERSLSDDDGDEQVDLYLHDGSGITLLTPGTADTLQFGGISADGSHAFWTTGEPLVDQDDDSAGDVYERSGGTTRLVSVSPGAPSDTIAGFQRASDDGSRVFFTTLERLDPVNDTDELEDIYERRDDSQTVLVSTGPNTRGIEGANGHHFATSTPDGTAAFFDSADSIGDDGDTGSTDVFMRAGGETVRLSVGERNDDDFADSSYAGHSADLTRFFFQTEGRFAAGDEDLEDDLYERTGGHTYLISPTAEDECIHATFECTAKWKGNSADGRRVWFTSRERLHPLDGDDEQDVYESRATGLPTVALGGSDPLMITEGDAPVAAAPALDAGDRYDELVAATVAVTGGFSPGEDALSFSPREGIDIALSSDGRTLALSGRAPVAAYEAALRDVRFASSDEDPGGEDRTLSIEVDNGGHTAAAQRTVRIAPVEDAPELSLPAATAGEYVEGAAPAPLAAGLTVGDPDSDALATATVAVTEGWRSGEDELGWTDVAGVTGARSADGSAVTFTGAAAPAEYQALLRSVTYRNTSDAPDPGARKVALRAGDGVATSEAATTAIGVAPVNDAPAVTVSSSTLGVLADGGLVPVDDALAVADPDSPSLAGATVRIASGFAPGADALHLPGGAGGIAASFAGDTLTLSGAAPRAAYEAALRAVRLSTTAGTGARAVAITVDDGAAGAPPAIRAVSVTGLAAAPPSPPLPPRPAPSRRRPATQAWLDVDDPLALQGRFAPVGCAVDAGSIFACRVTAAMRRRGRLVRVGVGTDRADVSGLRRIDVSLRIGDRGLRLLRARGGATRLHLSARVVRGGGGRALRTSARTTLRRTAR